MLQHQGQGGSPFPFPIGTIQRAPGSGQDVRSVLPFQNNKLWFWEYEDFLYDAYPSDAPLTLYDQSASGSPSTGLVSNATGGVYGITLASTNELEIVGFDKGDNLLIQGNLPFYFETRVKVVHTMAANEKLVFGLASAMNPTLDNITRNAWFLLAGSTDLLIETDDGTDDNDDKDTGHDITAGSFYIYSIERGVDGIVYFTKADGDGQNRKTWTMSRTFGLNEPSFGANNLQPVILASKSTGTTQPQIQIDYLLYGGARA